MTDVNKEEKYDIEFFSYDNKLKSNVLDDAVLEKYNKLYFEVRAELLYKIAGQGITKSLESNYLLYYDIISIVNNSINTLYNEMLLIKDSSKYKETKTNFINIIKFETKRLIKIKKNMKNLEKDKIKPNYINNILNTYDIDDETKVKVVYFNISNEIRSQIIDSILNGTQLDTEDLVKKKLEEYDLNEELKVKILGYYQKENKIKIKDSNND